MYTFNFRCCRCGEQFNVQFKYMLKKDSIVCPNCSNSLPEDAFHHIKAVATSLEEYGKIELGKDNEFKHFEITIR